MRLIYILLIAVAFSSCASYTSLIDQKANISNSKKVSGVSIHQNSYALSASDSILYIKTTEPNTSMKLFKINENKIYCWTALGKTHVEYSYKNPVAPRVNFSETDSIFTITPEIFIKTVTNNQYYKSLLKNRFSEIQNHFVFYKPLGKEDYRTRSGKTIGTEPEDFDFFRTSLDSKKVVENNLATITESKVDDTLGYLFYKFKNFTIDLNTPFMPAFSGCLLTIPNIFGMPFTSSICTVNIELCVYDRKGDLIRSYESSGTAKAYMAYYYGYYNFMGAAFIKATQACISSNINKMVEDIDYINAQLAKRASIIN